MFDPRGVSQWFHDWLDEEGMDVVMSDDGATVDIRIPQSDDRHIRVVVEPMSEFLVFGMMARTTVPRANFSRLYPLLAQANAEVPFGAWVLDPDREAIAYRAALPGRGAVYEPRTLRRVLAHVARTVGSMEAAFRGVAVDDVLASWLAEDEE
jgi:hypothetical protein